MAETLTLFIIGAVIVLGLIAKSLFSKTKFPDVLLLMFFGAVLSFFGLAGDLKTPNNMLNVLTTFALIYIVFNGGLPIRIKAVFSSAKWVLISSILNFIGITLIVGLVSFVFGFSWQIAIIIGILLCVMDGSIINGLLEVFNFSKRGEAFIQMESALTDVFVIVAVVTALNFANTNVGTVLQQIVNFVLLSSAIGVITALIWVFVLKKIGSMRHAPITTMAILILVYVFAEYFAANGVIAVFVFSITLGNTYNLSNLLYKKDAAQMGTFSTEQRGFFDDISFLLRTLLFVYIGALVDFSMPWYLLLGLFLAVLAFVSRSFIYKVLNLKNIPNKEKKMFEVMSPKGLTPVVLVSLISGSHQFTNTIIGAIFFSVIISSVLIFLIEKKKFTTITDLIFSKKVLKSSKS